jgi:hypothetical protein
MGTVDGHGGEPKKTPAAAIDVVDKLAALIHQPPRIGGWLQSSATTF